MVGLASFALVCWMATREKRLQQTQGVLHGRFNRRTNVFARSETTVGKLEMRRCRRGHRNGVDGRIIDDRAEIGGGIDFRIQPLHVGQSFRFVIADGPNVGRCQGSEVAE